MPAPTVPPDPGAAPAAPAARVPPDVLRLGLVSFLTDLSSEMIFAVFAVFFTRVAGASTALLGLVEGLADLSASLLSWPAGRLSDATGWRKPLAIAGYGFSTLAKGLLVLSSAVPVLALFRVVERLGKGFRGPPRDAWLAAIAPKEHRGRAFGVHQALDKAGAVVGPLVAFALLRALGETQSGWRLLFVVALVPAVASVLLLATMRERRGPVPAASPAPAPIPDTVSVAARPAATTPDRLARFLWPAAVFALGYYSLGFLLLKARASGFDTAEVVLLYALFNASCVGVSPMLGRLGDRVGRARLIPVGYLLFATVNLVAALAPGRAPLVAAFALYGVFVAIDESQSRAFVADLAPARRASALGRYQAVTGVLYVAASLGAGWLWQRSIAAPFLVAAAVAVTAAGVFAVARPRP